VTVATYTRRQIVDMIPEFLTKRSASFAPIGKRIAEEAGLSEAALGTLNAALLLREGDVVRRATYAWRSPYAVKRPAIEKAWAELVAAGFAEATADGWRVHRKAVELGEGVSRHVRAHISAYALPADATKRSADAFERLAARVPADARRAELAGRMVVPYDGAPADVLRLNRAALVLWGFRDDCHVGAWQDAGYEGPAFEVLSFVWSSPDDVTFTKIGGHGSIDALEKALAARQDRADVERSVDALARRGDLARNGDDVRITEQGQRARDGIEAETDRRFFAVWDLDDAATARLGDDLRAVIDALPKA
jgi:hypothetical protein